MKNSPIQIFINGEEFVKFKELEIHQEYSNHHSFTIIQSLEDNDINESLRTSYGYIGKKISVKITENIFKTNQEFVFLGLITDAVLHRKNGSFGEIHIKGYSPTIKMDAAQHNVSYTEKTMSDIIQLVTMGYNGISELKPNLNLKNDKSKPFTVQYNETDFRFLQRLSRKNGQWFFYDGEQLHFGQPKGKDIELNYGELLKDFNIEMKAVPNQFQWVGYESSSASTENIDSSSISANVSGVNKIVFDSSKDIFPVQHNKLYSNYIEEDNISSHLHDRAEQEVQASSSKMIIAKGISEELGLKIGTNITIKDTAFSSTSANGIKHSAQNYGSYVVTKIIHQYERTGEYMNHFEAVPEDCIVPPNANVFATAKAEIQPAVVTDNNDPKGLGRVKAQFSWQKSNGETTPWIRLVNPHAGSGKGHYFIPEIGEEVLVGFEKSNPEKPFVFGAMYNGSEKSGYATAGNDQKVIHTRSGTKMIMNDAIGSIYIEDPSGNTWHMDGKGNISVNAPVDINITAGANINMSAGKTINKSAGANINSNATMNITESAGVNKSESVGAIRNMFVGGDSFMNITGKLTEVITGDVHSETKKGENVLTAEKGMNFSSNGKIEKHSEKEVDINAAEKSKMF